MPLAASTCLRSRQHRLFAALRRLTHAVSRRAPTVVVIEDLHWIDGASEAFLASLVDALPGTRTVLVVTFRPEYHAGWMQRSYHQQLALPPLAPEAARELLRELLGADPLLAGLADHIHACTEGNLLRLWLAPEVPVRGERGRVAGGPRRSGADCAAARRAA